MFPFQSPFPINELLQQMMKHSKGSSSIEKLVQESISKSVSASLDFFGKNATNLNRVLHANQVSDDEEISTTEQMQSSKLTPAIFVTHDHVYVRIRIKDPSKLANAKIYHTSNQVIMEGYPHKSSYHVFSLPMLVLKKGASTSYKDEYLQIKMPKATDLQYTELDVPPLE